MKSAKDLKGASPFRRLMAVYLKFGIGILGWGRERLQCWFQALKAEEPSPHRPVMYQGWVAPSSVPLAESLCAIMDGLHDEVTVIGADRLVRYVNSAVRARLGADVPILGQRCYRLSRGTEQPCRICPLDRVLLEKAPVRLSPVHWQEPSAGQSDCWVEVVLYPICEGANPVNEVIELVRDLSESRGLEEEIMRANRELSALNAIARVLSQSLDLGNTLQAVAETMIGALEAQVVWVELSEGGSGPPAIQVSHGVAAAAINRLREAVAIVAPSEHVATSACHPALAGRRGKAERSAWQFAVMPLRSKGAILGTIGFATIGKPLDEGRIRLADAIGNQIAVMVERFRFYNELRMARDQRGQLLHKAITAQEDERKRIARELHDETGQSLTALRLSLERLVMTPDVSDDSRERLRQSLSICEEAEEEVDKILADLRPGLLDDLGLVEAVEFHANERLKAEGIDPNVVVTGRQRRLSSEKETALFRVIQESLNNIIKHAHARSVMIHLEFGHDQLLAAVEDDGCGFDTQEVAHCSDPARGLGIAGMKERMSLVGGTLTVVSEPGAGTSLRASVPLDTEGAE